MRASIFLALLSGCLVTASRATLSWDLDASGCTLAGGATVEWVFHRGADIVETLGFPCRDGSDETIVPSHDAVRAFLLNSTGNIVAACDATEDSGDLSCAFGLVD